MAAFVDGERRDIRSQAKIRGARENMLVSRYNRDIVIPDTCISPPALEGASHWGPLPSNRPLLLVLGLRPALRSGCPAKPGPVSSRRAAESLDLGVHESSPTVVAFGCFWFPYIETLEDGQVPNPKFLEPGTRVRIFS